MQRRRRELIEQQLARSEAAKAAAATSQDGAALTVIANELDAIAKKRRESLHEWGRDKKG
jgi:hypothetical protein